MAISKNFILKGARGAIGKQLVVREYGDKTVLSSYPDMSNRVLSRNQVRRTMIMKKANAEIKKIKADDRLRKEAQLRLNVPSNKLHHALLKELLLKFGNEVEGK